MCAFLNLIKIRQELFTHVLKTIWSFFQLLQVLGLVDSRWRSSNFELSFLPLPFFFTNYVEGWMRKKRSTVKDLRTDSEVNWGKTTFSNQDVLFGFCYQFVSNIDCRWLLNVCYSKLSHCHSFLIKLVKHANSYKIQKNTEAKEFRFGGSRFSRLRCNWWGAVPFWEENFGNPHDRI